MNSPQIFSGWPDGQKRSEDIQISNAAASFSQTAARCVITALVASLLPCPVQAATTAAIPQITQPLAFERASDMVICGDGARFAGFFQQHADEPIVMEAELATHLEAKSTQSLALSAETSGGSYIRDIKSVGWDFHVARAGSYTVWERFFFSVDGSWNHQQKLDADARTFDYGKHGPDEGWQWIKCGKYDLEKGKHRLQVTFGGPERIDVVVLSSSDTPPDNLNLTSSYSGPGKGELWTNPIRPLDVAKWKEAHFRPGSSAECDYSSDDGRSWKPFTHTALEEIAVAGSGKDSIQFHLKVSQLPGSSGTISGGSISYLPGPNSSIVLENNRSRIELNGFGIRSIYDKKSGNQVCQSGTVENSLIILSTKKVGPSPIEALDLHHAALKESGVSREGEIITGKLDYRFSNGIHLEVRIQLLANGQTEWKCTVDNQSDLEIAEINFPRVNGIQLGEQSNDDWIFVPKVHGQVYQNPAVLPTGPTYWGPAMRWSMLWDPSQGFYLGIEDQRIDDCGFRFESDGSRVTLSPVQRILAKPKTRWESATYRTALTGGDWHEGADIYREFVAGKLNKCDRPEHVRWLFDGWCSADANNFPSRGWDSIQQSAYGLGFYYMSAWRAMLDGADNTYCGLYPYPCLTWGSVREYVQALDALKARGAMYSTYHNTHLWVSGYGHHPRVLSFPKSLLPKDAPVPDDAWYLRNAAYNYDGTCNEQVTDYAEWVDMAMQSKGWRDWLAYWTGRYLDWGCDGMYYDQFNIVYFSGKLYPGYDTYGSWTRATLDLISSLKAESRAKNPWFTSTGESCIDTLGQFLDLHMTSGSFNRLEFFSYCNPDQLLLEGGCNGGTSARYDGVNRHRFTWQIGARFDNIAGDLMGRTPEEHHQWATSILALRKEVKSMLYESQFRDTVGLTVRDQAGRLLEPEYRMLEGGDQAAPHAGVYGRWFRFSKEDQSGAVINFINDPVRKDAVALFSTKEIGPVISALAFTLDGRRMPVEGRQEGDSYTFAIPDAELSSVVLASTPLRPLVTWEIDPVCTPGIEQELKVSLVNLNPTPLSGSIALKLPQGWKEESIQFSDLKAGDKTEVRLPVAIPKTAAKGRTDIRARISTPNGNFTTYNFIMINDPVLAEFRGSPGSYHLWLKNLGTVPVSGIISYSAPRPLTIQGGKEFSVPARQEVTLPVEIRGNEELDKGAEVTVDIQSSVKLFQLVRHVFPAIPNGNFESDSAGDQKPDWWMARSSGEKWAYESIHLAGEAHSGKYCLKLDPPKDGNTFNCAFPEMGALVPGKKYRFSAWIKAKSSEQVYLSIPGVSAQLGAGETSDEWKQFQVEFVAPPDFGGRNRWAHNFSSEPAYFDDFRIERLD